MERKTKVLENIQDIIKRNELVKREKLLPKHKKILEASKVVEKFIRTKQRKVYGGIAINETIKLKDSKQKIYEDNDDIPDWDFYSPEPIKDAWELMIEFDKLGYKSIQMKEAFHANTYKIKIENYEGELADISYIWNNYYYKIPTIMINGINYVSPVYQIMDMYRAFVNPMLGWFKIEKYYHRASILEELYMKPRKLPDVKKYFTEKKSEPKMIELKNSLIKNVISNNDNIIVIGSYAYNYLMTYSKVPDFQKRRVSSDRISLITNNLSETVTTIIDHLEDHLTKDKKSKKSSKSRKTNLISGGIKTRNSVSNINNSARLSSDENLNNGSLIKKIKFYPFLELYGRSVEILYDMKPLVKVYETDICFPYFTNNKLNIGSYHLVMLYLMANRFRTKVTKNEYQSKVLNYMIQNLNYAREYWFRKNNKIGIEKSPFQELQSICMGDDFETGFQKFIQKKVKYQVFLDRLPPNADKKKYIENAKNYIYPNRSGNPEIKNIPKLMQKESGELLKLYPELKSSLSKNSKT